MTDTPDTTASTTSTTSSTLLDLTSPTLTKQDLLTAHLQLILEKKYIIEGLSTDIAAIGDTNRSGSVFCFNCQSCFNCYRCVECKDCYDCSSCLLCVATSGVSYALLCVGFTPDSAEVARHRKSSDTSFILNREVSMETFSAVLSLLKGAVTTDKSYLTTYNSNKELT